MARRYRVAGRAMNKRGMGKTVFVPLRDTTGDLQLFINVDHLAAEDFANVLPGAISTPAIMVAAEGLPRSGPSAGELSILATRFWITAKSLRPLPDKHKGLTDKEQRYRQRYVDLAINPAVRDVFRKRTQITRGIRRFLDARSYLEVETPMLHSIIGGAAARPFRTHHNALDMPLYLRIAPELYLKRLVVGGFDRVYELNRNFRNEGLSRRHNPEFTMLELYQAYATYTHLMDATEELFGELARDGQRRHDGHVGGHGRATRASRRRGGGSRSSDAVRFELGGIANADAVFEDLDGRGRGRDRRTVLPRRRDRAAVHPARGGAICTGRRHGRSGANAP